jgi:hypothetical protein
MSTETVAIIVPGVVAVAAILATWHQHLRGRTHERELADLANVRDVLDEAAVALHRVAYVLDDVRSYLTQYGGVSFFKTDNGTTTYELLGSQGRDLDALVERLSVRFGAEHDVVTAFSEADGAVLRIWRAAGLLRQEPESDGHAGAARQIRALNNEKEQAIRVEREEFDGARKRFVAAAHDAAGSRLM